MRLVLRSVICSFSDFNPRTPRGVRPVRQFSTQRKAVFQSTHPARGATLDDFARTCVLMEFQSTHPARGATLPERGHKGQAGISIHAPREGCDGDDGLSELTGKRFQSTHPARGATKRLRPAERVETISIHAPREGCDASMELFRS